MIRHREPGEETATEVFLRLGWRLRRGFWTKAQSSFSHGAAQRIWEQEGPRKLELLIKEKER